MCAEGPTKAVLRDVMVAKSEHLRPAQDRLRPTSKAFENTMRSEIIGTMTKRRALTPPAQSLPGANRVLAPDLVNDLFGPLASRLTGQTFVPSSCATWRATCRCCICPAQAARPEGLTADRVAAAVSA